MPPVQVGSMPLPKGSLVASSNPAIMVKSVKQGDRDPNVLVIRLVEYSGHDGETLMKLHPELAAKVKKTIEGDLLERAIGEGISLDNPLRLGKWEIKTVLLVLS